MNSEATFSCSFIHSPSGPASCYTPDLTPKSPAGIKPAYKASVNRWTGGSGVSSPAAFFQDFLRWACSELNELKTCFRSHSRDHHVIAVVWFWMEDPGGGSSTGELWLQVLCCSDSTGAGKYEMCRVTWRCNSGCLWGEQIIIFCMQSWKMIESCQKELDIWLQIWVLSTRWSHVSRCPEETCGGWSSPIN